MSETIKVDEMRAKSLVSALQSVRERVGKVAGGRDVCFAPLPLTLIPHVPTSNSNFSFYFYV
jgi:hypothetical protein